MKDNQTQKPLFAHIVAAYYHNGQVDRIKKDYIHHLSSVAQIALFVASQYERFETLNREHIEMTAMLHDILEDTTYPIEDFKNGVLFIENETDIELLAYPCVLTFNANKAITCEGGMPKAVFEAVKLLTKNRENYNAEQYFSEIYKNPLACVVKIADLMHNSNLCRFMPIENTFQKTYSEDISMFSRGWKKVKLSDIERTQDYLNWLHYLMHAADKK